jgi:hypothetical protein
MAALAAVFGVPGAWAAPYSGLSHVCSYHFGVGSYQDVSYDGRTGCPEAGILIGQATNQGRNRPHVGARTVRLPHGTWRCVTVRWREVHGVIESSHRVSCSLVGDPRGYHARVRYFYES